MKKITVKSKSKKRAKKKTGTDREALMKAVWEIHNSFGYKFTQEKLEQARKSLWG